MASADLNVAVKKDWPLGNPWPWLASGVALALWSWLWTLIFQARASDNRVIVLAVGLLLTGIGLWLRWADRQTVHLLAWSPVVPRSARLLMGLLFAWIGLSVTVLLVFTFFQTDALAWKPAATSLIWISVAPLCWCACRRVLDFKRDRAPINADEEIGLAFMVAALTCGLGSMTLDLGPACATDWDTLRMFLRVTMAVALVASALAVVSMQARRLVLSLLVALHFAGIATASLSAQPSPWLVQQVWARIFRPYLEFMYLNNAYHFYAPEPGPARYLWFRLIYTTPDGREVGAWYKVPEMDENGRSQHSVPLEYQRFLSLTESTAPTEAPPQSVFTNAQGVLEAHPMFVKRLELLPGQALIVGQPSSNHVKVPLHPNIPQMQQIMIPNESTRRLLASYARFVAHKFAKDPTDPSLTFKSVKVYIVVHWVPTSTLLNYGISPNDPELYRPYYMGEYDRTGKLLDSQNPDPYLYWLLPILRDNGNDPDSPIKDWARRHAGDPNYIRPRGQTNWHDSASMPDIGAERKN